MTYNTASLNHSHFSVGHTTSLHTGSSTHAKFDDLVLLAATAYLSDRVNPYPPLTAWYKRDSDLSTSSIDLDDDNNKDDEHIDAHPSGSLIDFAELRKTFLRRLVQPAQFPGAKVRKMDEEHLQFFNGILASTSNPSPNNTCRGNAAYDRSTWLGHKRRCMKMYKAWLEENGYEDQSWIEAAERRRDARLGMSVTA
ncbi:uncharacterized protein BT62DRAFT_924385 [Guyanagaster necrorhizus]|uniref:Uncharacterized protein n=1 Tax=Guyanagaster necrorhizus TaxID=856835 RepID=A0A9P8AMK7_9AGAR|nr:uncharacterized protein BT62DRAFT_924385 [Guyanagaster necrorhizus MCA 3950]KAG7439942.1 hypothetical protein BT62DRAFT_924385 [Guyanagaster necrorhizus MCA 3950]